MMLWRLLKTERMKLKRSPVWLAFLIMPVIPAFLGTINYLGNLELLKSEWYSLWTQYTLFTCYFFLPILLGVYCSYLMRLEHSNHNWNKLLTMPVPRSLVFLSKLLTISFMLLLSELWIGILFVLAGKIAGITAPVPFDRIILWCLCGTLGGMVMSSIQLLLSLFLKSFALPVGIALGGGLSGLVFLAKGYGHIWPYALMAYGMNANAPQELMAGGYASFLLICIAYIIAFTIAGSMILQKKEL